jgi:hypothetical protein
MLLLKKLNLTPGLPVPPAGACWCCTTSTYCNWISLKKLVNLTLAKCEVVGAGIEL